MLQNCLPLLKTEKHGNDALLFWQQYWLTAGPGASFMPTISSRFSLPCFVKEVSIVSLLLMW